jgi:hypothetical protein
VIALLADANIQGHIARLVERMQSDTWRDFWDHIELRYLTFADIGLNPADKDSLVWQRCQEYSVFLLTNNRRKDEADSLEATIREQNTSESLPVFTLGEADNLLTDDEYADRVIDRLYRYLFEIDNIRGTGRLYLP